MAAPKSRGVATVDNLDMIELDDLVDSEQEEEPYIERHMSHGWRPKYLRRRVVSIFNLLFMIHIIGLQILNGISTHEQGFTFAGVDVFNACRLGLPAGMRVSISPH